MGASEKRILDAPQNESRRIRFLHLAAVLVLRSEISAVQAPPLNGLFSQFSREVLQFRQNELGHCQFHRLG